MDEVAALEISAVRALELRDPARVVWTEADRAWASRAAAEVVGEQADSATFLARRARLALERISGHAKALPRAARTLRWRPWVAWTIIGGAFVLGVIVDRRWRPRINLLRRRSCALFGTSSFMRSSSAASSSIMERTPTRDRCADW
jgi:hypothetical protein